jgi:hypothetical protein
MEKNQLLDGKKIDYPRYAADAHSRKLPNPEKLPGNRFH